MLSRKTRPNLYPRARRNGTQYGPNKRPRFSADPSIEIDDIDPQSVAAPKLQKYIVGVDFGTTFSSISYFAYSTPDEKAGVRASDIKSIKNWPGDNVNNGRSEQVPMVIWYPTEPIKRDPIRGVQFDCDAKKYIIESELRTVIFDDKAALRKLKPWKKNDDRLKDAYFGYQALWNRYNICSERDRSLLVFNAKSELFKAPHTKKDKEMLRAQLRNLISMGIIRKYGKRDASDVRDVRDLITDLFVKLLQHTKRELIVREGFTEECPVEWQLAIPTIWSPISSDVMKIAMEDAIRITGFGKREAPIALSTGTEPEFAATWILEKCLVPLDGKNVTIFDNGGGTCDAATFRIRKRDSLRLEERIGDPSGCACGGSYANKRYSDLLAKRLSSEDYLWMNGDTLGAFVDSLIPDFESNYKRMFDVVRNPPTPAHAVSINGLRGDRQMGRTGSDLKRFEDNKLVMDSSDYEEIFQPLLNDMWAVLREQLETVKMQGELVRSVVLVGGFSAAPSVRSFIKINLAAYAQDVTQELKLKSPYRIPLIEDPDKCVTAVASGGVLRGLKKEPGSLRKAQLSYGLLNIEPFKPDQPGHKLGTAITDHREGAEGAKYIHVINYFIVQGKNVNPVHKYPWPTITHSIDLQELDAGKFYCEEIIYVSDRPGVSNYPLTCERNMGAHEVHRILVDMSFFREELKFKRVQGERYCDFKYDLLLWVEGKTLNYEVRYPAVAEGQDAFDSQEDVKVKGQICITAAFPPGTV